VKVVKVVRMFEMGPGPIVWQLIRSGPLPNEGRGAARIAKAP